MKVWNKNIVHVEWISTGTQLDVFLVFLDKYGHSLKSVASIFSIPILYFPCCLWTKLAYVPYRSVSLRSDPESEIFEHSHWLVITMIYF